jgi:hypothetical protein
MEPMGNCQFCGADGVDMEHVSDCAHHDAQTNPPLSSVRRIAPAEIDVMQIQASVRKPRKIFTKETQNRSV